MFINHDEFIKENLLKWEKVIKEIFPNEIPNRYTWRNIDEIISVLNKLGNISHAFMPSGGGDHLCGAKKSLEDGCIELDFGAMEIVKPISLTFHSFSPEYYEWAYFRLETGGLKPSGIYQNLNHDYEELTELPPGKYVNRSVWDAGFFGYDESGDEIPLPKGTRVISRLFKGAYVIFAEASSYNRVSSTYDGRHNKMSSEEFEDYILNIIKRLP